ncbi:MAG: hypothetical protein MK212_19500, partial [Saprospiraceae bacterium]|nr:hypothetical protein [Saprospiraceae bacterium]
MLIVSLSFGTLTNTFGQGRPVVKLRNLERAPGTSYRIVPNADGVAEWMIDPSGNVVVNLTAITYVPTTTGNALNNNEVVTDPNGDIWIIDSTGDAIKIGSTSTFSGSWNNLTDAPAGFSDGVDNTTDADSDATNEIQNSNEVTLSTNLVINGGIVSTVQEALEAIAALREKQTL